MQIYIYIMSFYWGLFYRFLLTQYLKILENSSKSSSLIKFFFFFFSGWTVFDIEDTIKYLAILLWIGITLFLVISQTMPQ